MDNKKPKKKVENPVREWISDNLRYIMLIGAIVLIILIVVFLIIGFSNRNKNSAAESSAVSSQSAVENTEEKSEAVSEEKTSEVTAAPTSSPAAEQADAETQETSVQSAQLTEADTDAVDIVTTYFNALAQADAEKAASVCENISAEDMASIAAGEYAQSYNNFKVYSYPGDVEGSYVVFVEYEYQYDGYDTALPALTQLYVFTKDDGSLCIASDETQNAKEEFLDSVLENEDVKELTEKIQQEYDIALAGDPALAEYLNS